MWILENDGDVFQGRRFWLRPGKKFLFGRTGSEDGQVLVSDKTISRKHLTVAVHDVQPGDCANARARSRVTLTDLGTKIGTLVNGEQIRGKSYDLPNAENVVALGRYKYHFRLTWVPITFTFSFTTKEQKANPYTALYDLLGPLDIKVLVDYERGLTTHLVAKKRNTSKGLQALIDGKYIVHNDSFVKAVIAAATATTTPSEDRSQATSLLERDFYVNFPDALQYLPPRGEEPTQRDASAYAPNPLRQDMFEGYTFVFYEKRQFETLLAPITEGRGKAMLREVIPNVTTVDEFVRYVKDVAGEKGLGEFEDGSEGKGVVVVRFNPVKGPGSEWFAEFGRKVALYLGHRLIEQNEFLDAILGNDASVLRRPLEVEASGVIAPPPTAVTSTTSRRFQGFEQAPSTTIKETAATSPTPARRGRSRRVVTSRFKGFDDDDDHMDRASLPESIALDPIPAMNSQSHGLFVSQDPGMNVDQDRSRVAESRGRTGRKRPASPIDEEEEDIMDQMAPATTALKKRRLAEGISTPPPRVAPEQPATKFPPKKVKKEIDVLEVARQQREKAEALANAERETLQEQMKGMDMKATRNLAIVEEIEVKRSMPPSHSHARADESERWDDKWNGRKDFKKFRRRGANGDNARDLNRVIVPLEEVKKKDFGIGDEYWLEGDGQRKKKKGRGKETQDVSQSQSQSRHKGRAAERAAEILANEAEEEIAQAQDINEGQSSDIEDVESPPKAATSSRSLRSQKLADKTSNSQNLRAQNKRAASPTLTKPAPEKKARQAVMRKAESDDSEDELKFRFRKRN